MTTNPSSTSHSAPTDPSGPTGQLSNWVQSVSIDDVPQDIQLRSKYLILDGLACLLVGAHLPWSQTAVRSFLSFEPSESGPCNIYGWKTKISPLQAALLNSTFIQGFELDDWHSDAPLHSNSLLLPALLAAAEQEAVANKATVSGSDFLLSTIVGYEVGPRVGIGLWGGHILTAGWHSGAVFGPAAVASAVSKLLGLPAGQIEDALGIACTQACGLMSAQFGADVKRMQHGFAARNGLTATLLARGGYTGIKKVFEEKYGGFLVQFSSGNGKEPQYLPEEVSKELGETWKIKGIRVKPYAAMAATHSAIDCVRLLQEEHPEAVKPRNLKNIKAITIEMDDIALSHGGWKATRPLTTTGAQMNIAYAAATQFIDSQVLAAQFSPPSMLERDEVWDLVEKTTCVRNEKLGGPFAQRLIVEFEGDVESITVEVKGARGVEPALTNDEILEKWRLLTKDLIDDKKRKEIEEIVLNLETCENIQKLADLMVEINGTENL